MDNSTAIRRPPTGCLALSLALFATLFTVGADSVAAHRSAESAQRLWQSYRSKTPVAANLAVEAAQRAVESGTLEELSALEAAVKLAQVRMTEADLRRRAVEAVVELDALTDCRPR